MTFANSRPWGVHASVAARSALWLMLEQVQESEAPLTAQTLRQIMRRHVLTSADVAAAVSFDPAACVWQLISAAPRYEASLLCALPGQATPIEDQAGAESALLVLSGRLQQRVFEWTGGDRVVPSRTNTLALGRISANGAETIHQLLNVEDRPLVVLQLRTNEHADRAQYVVEPAASGVRLRSARSQRAPSCATARRSAGGR